MFRRLRAETGTSREGTTRAAIYGMGHSFAVATSLGWYRDGTDISAPIAAFVDLHPAPGPALGPAGT